MSASIIAAIVVIDILQVYYFVSEIVLAVRTKQKTGNSADRGTQRLIWILIVVCGFISWAPVILDFGRILVLGDWLTWVGVALMITGITFRQYVISFLGRFFTGQVQIQSDHELIREGPYRYVRHPSYLGMLILELGMGIALANWFSLLLCLVLPPIGIIQRIKVEEGELKQHFGQRYLDYRKSTWALIPYIY